jgi:cytoskeleton protein RodZ
MTDAAATTGQLLKAERERRGLSSQKAADELHLDGWVIEALEAEDYARVGPSVYAKGHLKRYAALLGLSPSDILARYESRTQTPQAAAQQPANVRLRTDTRAATNLPWAPILGSLTVAIVVLGMLWWKPWQQGGAGAIVERRAQESPPAAPTDAAANSAANLTANSPADSPGDSSGGEKAATATATAPMPATVTPAALPLTSDADTAGTGHARLRLSFSADSWVDVHDAQGKRAFAGQGRANSVKTIAGPAPMHVYLGFASGVQLEINNRAVAIGPQFVAGDVARFDAGADGVLRRDSHAVVPPTVPTRNAHPTG